MRLLPMAMLAEKPTPGLSIDEPVAMENNCLSGAMRLPDGRFLMEWMKE